VIEALRTRWTSKVPPLPRREDPPPRRVIAHIGASADSRRTQVVTGHYPSGNEPVFSKADGDTFRTSFIFGQSFENCLHTCMTTVHRLE
jgi:hypothetical protein